ncbi:NUDIX domain-containing protein [Kitasatospora indigofera]|uniref:NUDIX domain-containing protein n=1 Tax=Kitasatospora indigofera TaxID=67307 RepID=UPI00368E7317
MSRPTRQIRATLVATFTDGTVLTDHCGRLPARVITGAPVLAAARLARGLHRESDGPVPALAAIDRTADGLNMLVHLGPLPATPSVPAGHRRAPYGAFLEQLGPAPAAAVRTAVRTALLGRPVADLTDGHPPGHAPTRTERTSATYTWHPAARPVPAAPVAQVWGWLLDRRGRALLILDSRGVASLPGGRPDPGEDDRTTLAREAAEEASATIGPPRLLGDQALHRPGHPLVLQRRMTAHLLSLGPSRPDPDTGETYTRLLVPASWAQLLLGWGPEGDEQATALAVGDHQGGIEEVPTQGLAQLTR